MTEQKNLLPKRRFKQFHNEIIWNQLELKKIAPLQRGFDLTKSLMKSGPYPVVFSNGIGAWNSEYKVKGPGVVTGRSGSIGNVSYIDDDFWPHNTSLWVTNFFDNYPLFIYYLYQNVNLTRFGSGSGVPTLNRNDVHDYSTSIPKIDEQIRIGNFLKHFDDLIILQQHKLEKTKALKAAYLSEMFPAEGEFVPKRRFAGFTKKWEEKKMSEITDIYDGTHQTPKYTRSGIKFVSVENISTLESTKFISRTAYDNEYSNKQAKKGDVLMTRIGDIGTTRVIETHEPLAYYVTLALLKPKQINSYFLAYLISSPAVQKNIWKRTLHIAFPKKINLSEINQIDLLLPTIDEQAKIGNFFKALDDTITLHERKLEKLQNLKKAYLHEMFV